MLAMEKLWEVRRKRKRVCNSLPVSNLDPQKEDAVRLTTCAMSASHLKQIVPHEQNNGIGDTSTELGNA